MKKYLTILLLALLMTPVQMEAQMSTPVRKSAPQRKTTGEGQFSYTYFTGIDFQPFGTAKKETYDCAIWIPENFAGMQIKDMSFLLYDKAALNQDEVSVWVSAELPTDIHEGVLYHQTLPAGELVNWNEDKNDGEVVVTLGDGVEIPTGGCYVGYSMTVTNNGTPGGMYPIFLTYEQPDQPGGFWWRTSQTVTDWTDMYGAGYGNLTTTVTIQGTFPTEALAIQKTFTQTNVLKDNNCKIPVTLTGGGINPITSFTYVVTDANGGNAWQQRFKINGTTISLNEPVTAYLIVPSDSEKGLHQRRIVITQVNDLPNQTSDSVCVGNTLTLDEGNNRRVLFEEITGTKCGWCPRGITAMDSIQKVFPDAFIGIAYHMYNQDDPMFNTDYIDMVDYYESAPTCMLNRQLRNLDPYYGSNNDEFGILSDIESVLQVPSEAQVTVHPMWDETGNSIDITTDITFAYNNASAPYRLAYAVVEDGLTSKAEEWLQANYYRSIYDQGGAEAVKKQTGIDESSPLWAWTQKSIYVKGMVFDNVCLTADSLANGLPSSIAAPIVEGQQQRHTYSINMSERTTVMKRKQNVRVVALLINTDTGQVTNADSRVVEANTTRISDIDSDDSRQQGPIYNLAGQRVGRDYRGIGIQGGKKILIRK